MRRSAAWRTTAAPATARDGTRRPRTRRTDSAGCRLRARRRTLRAARRTNPPVEPNVDAASRVGAHGRRGGKPAATAASVSKAASTLPGGKSPLFVRVFDFIYYRIFHMFGSAARPERSGRGFLRHRFACTR